MKKFKVNAYLMALYIYQFGIIQPIASIVNSQAPIIIFTSLLLIIMLLNNRFKIKKYVFFILIIFSLFFIFNSYIYKISMFVLLPIFIEFIAKGFSGFIFGSLDTDGDELYKAFRKLAIINFILISPAPFLSFYDSMNYMRFGYAMIPSTLLFFYDGYLSLEKNYLMKLMSIISLLLVFIYGSRGAILTFLVFCTIYIIFSKRISNNYRIIILLIILVVGYILYNKGYFVKIIDILYYDIGIKTYALAKFKDMIVNGLAYSSSGRDRIYKVLFNSIKENFCFGSGIGSSQILVAGTAHNIFIQIILESGIVGLIIWIFIWLICLKKYIISSESKNENYFIILTIIISVALGRLLVSSDMWLRPEYWFVISLLINTQCKSFD